MPAIAAEAGTPLIRHFGLLEYQPTWRAMQDFTAARDPDTPDEAWLLQHPPVYTLGLNGKPEHLLRADTGIPVVKVDRGGQITYHGPGQIIVYLLLDLQRQGLGVRALIRRMEQAVLDLLAGYGIAAELKAGAPGVYVREAKIAALGLRVKRGCCYHGLALNVDMNLAPFAAINPCGYQGMTVTQMRDLGIADSVDTIGERLLEKLLQTITSE
ncbi:MAG: lipoyl(octanoyl) transferase LipB [Pseudomonadota bacterium]